MMKTGLITTLLCGLLALSSFARQQSDGASSVDARQRWERLSEAERAAFRESFARWQKLGPAEKERMRERHQRWQELQESVDQCLADDERRRLQQLDEPARRREMHRQVRGFLEQRRLQIPPEIREELHRELEQLPVHERAQRVRETTARHIKHRLGQILKRLVQRGKLSTEEMEERKEQFEGVPRAKRFELLRHWMLESPEVFGLSPNAVRRLQASEDPMAAARVLDSLRRPREVQRMVEGFLRDQGIDDEQLVGLRGLAPPEFERQMRELLRQHQLRLPEPIRARLRETSRGRR